MAFASVARHFAMAQSEGAATSPSARGAGDSRDDGFVPVPKDEPLSPAPVRAPTAFITDPIRPRAVARPFKTTTPIPRLSTAPPSRVSQPSVKKVTSRFFSKTTPESTPDGAPLAARGDAPAVRRGGKMRRSHASLPDAVADARAALEDFRAAAAKKNAHKDHGDAAESVLIPFRPFVDARIAAHADAASGEVLFVRETTTLNDDDDDDEFGDRACTRLATGATTASKSLRARAADSHLPGAEAAGKVLAATLTELDRLHVNASCRVRQRAPAVAAARARLTQLRRECRDAFGALDPAGLLARAEASRAARRALPAARDAAYFASGRSSIGSIEELRDRCPLFARTRSPHHLCLHLCYYREYDPARQLFVLRTRCAAAKGSAAELDGWRADLVLALPRGEERRGEKIKRRRRRRRRGAGNDNSDDDSDDYSDDNSDEDDDADDGGDEGAGNDDGDAIERAVGDRKRRKRRTKRRAIEDGGWLAGDALPWRVRFVSPEGEHFHDGAEVLARLSVDAIGAGPAAANANGGGGLGNETLDDFDWAGAASAEIVGSPGTRVAGLGSPPAASRRGPGPRARGQVAPAPRRLDLGLGAVRSTHGGSGVRLARPEERGLDEATDLLRASLWPASADDDVGTTPVRHRRAAAAAGEPRSPFRLAPDPFEADGGVLGGRRSVDREDRASERALEGVDWWSPPRSPFGLLEEILWSDEWKLLVACMMLNCTTRLQVDRVLWRLFLLVPTPEDAVALGASDGSPEGFDGKSGLDRIEEILRPLGLHRKRARALVKLSEDYVAARGAAALPGPPGATGSDDDDDDDGGAPGVPGWSRLAGAPVASLHGVGAYASDAHALFCEGTLGVAPRDHALRWWYAWALERRESERRERRAARG